MKFGGLIKVVVNKGKYGDVFSVAASSPLQNRMLALLCIKDNHEQKRNYRKIKES